MGLELYIVKDGKDLRCGYTTGSCAAAASKAAVLMLESQKEVKYVEIDTPADVKLKLKVVNPIITKDYASCGIIKDAGDDPDKTDGMEIRSRVRKREDRKIEIDGGKGVGRITSRSLFGQVGQAAINKVPRKMIRQEIKSISNNGYDVVISAPMGEEIAKETFNKDIGIEGGISIIGTKGIVYPMSEEAFLKSIYMKINTIAKNQGRESIVFVPGNYGEELADKLYPNIARVKISNFIGDSLAYAYKRKYKSIKLLGHIGKFAKLSIGVFNTHSRVCDARIEAFVYYLALMEAPIELIKKINQSLTAEEALNICIDEGYGSIVKLMEKGAEDRIRKYIKDEEFNIEVRIYSMDRGINIC